MPLSGSFTQSFQQLVLDALGQRTVFDPAIDGLKLALFTADPGEGASTSNEISGGGYTRQAVALGDATNNASNHGEIANTAAISFAASGASWSGITHAGLFKANSLTRSIVGLTNSSEIDGSSNAQSDTKLLIPAAHSSTVATLTVTASTVVNPDNSSGSGDEHTVLTYSGSDGNYFTADPIGNATNFVRVKTGPLAGVCFDLIADGTNTITLDTYFKFTAEDIINHKVEVMAKVTLADLSGIVHNDSSTYNGSGYAASGSGFFGGSTSTGDRIYLHDPSQNSEIFYAQNATNFAGDNGWRRLGQSAAADAGSAVIPPLELWNHSDQTDDDYCILRTQQSADWTLTSQVSTTDQMLARFQFEDSGGNAQTLNVADGSSLDVAIGELKLTLN